MEKKQNFCCECKEGCVFGNRVYCNYDGRFHPPCDHRVCKKFEPRDLLIFSYEHDMTCRGV